MEFLTITTKYDIFIGDIVKFENGFYCVSLENQKPQVLEELQYKDFVDILGTIFEYKIIRDGIID